MVAYFTFPHALGFWRGWAGLTLQQIYAPNNYIGLMVALMVVFGLTFVFPVVLVSLELVRGVAARPG